MRTDYFGNLPEDEIEDLVYMLKQEQFEHENVIFREGDACRGIMYLMEGKIEISHVEEGQDIVVDTLNPGSYLFTYTFLTIQPIQITGVAKGRVNLLVLPMNSLNFTRRLNSKLREEIYKIENYIDENGVPKCDYTRYRPYIANP